MFSNLRHLRHLRIIIFAGNRVLEQATSLSLRLRLEAGRLIFEAEPPVNVAIRGATPFVRGRREGQAFEWVAAPLVWGGAGYQAANEALGLAIEVAVDEREDGVVLRATLRNTGAIAVQIEAGLG